MKLSEIKVGEQFVYYGNTYTKLNDEGYCLLDKYGKHVPRWSKYSVFDCGKKMCNDFDKSLIKQYINSDYFKSLLGVDYDVTLLSLDEFFLFKEIIKPFFDCSWLRSGSNTYAHYAYNLYASSSSSNNYIVNYSNAVRPALLFNLNSDVIKKI